MANNKKEWEKKASKRFLEVFDKLKGEGIIRTQKEFCDTCGFESQILSSLRNEQQNGLSLGVVAMAATHFPMMSLNYILRGEGQMLNLEGAQKPFLTSDISDLVSVLTNSIKRLEKENEKYINALAKIYDYLEGEGFDIEKLKALDI